jgi:hypothetical protein
MTRRSSADDALMRCQQGRAYVLKRFNEAGNAEFLVVSLEDSTEDKIAPGSTAAFEEFMRAHGCADGLFGDSLTARINPP